MNKVKTLKIIFLCLLVITTIVGILVAVKYIGIFSKDKEVKEALISINEKYENSNQEAVFSPIEAEYKGHKVIRNNRNF